MAFKTHKSAYVLKKKKKNTFIIFQPFAFFEEKKNTSQRSLRKIKALYDLIYLL